MTAPLVPDGVPAPRFVEVDVAALTSQLVAEFEALVGRPLRPGQPERVLVDFVVYQLALTLLRVQEAGEQALLATARSVMVDWIGDTFGVARLPATAARTTLRVTLVGPQPGVVSVPAGVRVQSADGAVTFATMAECEIPAGTVSAEVLAECSAVGPDGNGFLPGQLATVLDPRPLVASISNVSVSSGGADVEDDERLRTRIRGSHVRPSTAGSAAGYRAHALAASPVVLDAAVSSPAPGAVRVAVLTQSGQPTPELLDVVREALSDERVRPITDHVQVVAPTRVPYEIRAVLRRRRGTDLDVVLGGAQAAAQAWAAERRRRLGVDLVPSQLAAALHVPGVYDVALTAPAAAVLGRDAWADCTAVVLTDGGAVDD